MKPCYGFSVAIVTLSLLLWEGENNNMSTGSIYSGQNQPFCLKNLYNWCGCSVSLHSCTYCLYILSLNTIWGLFNARISFGCFTAFKKWANLIIFPWCNRKYTKISKFAVLKTSVWSTNVAATWPENFDGEQPLTLVDAAKERLFNTPVRRRGKCCSRKILEAEYWSVKLHYWFDLKSGKSLVFQRRLKSEGQLCKLSKRVT